MTAQPETVRTYLLVFGGLLVLTLVTTLVSFLDLGLLNEVVAMTIAVGKALLVALFFMHLRHSSRLVGLISATGILWLLILFALSLADYATRDALPGW